MSNRNSNVQFPSVLSRVSRRKFVQQMPLALGMAYHAVSAFGGGSTASVKESRSGHDHGFVCGAHFYHPQSGPQVSQFRTMIDQISNRYHFNTIQVWSNWDYYNPHKDEFQFDDLEKLLSICDDFGVKVLLTLMLESAPYWLEQAHPETRYVDAAGNAVRLRGSGAHYSGGCPGLCFDWPAVREGAERYIHELVRFAAPHKCLYAYDLWNEPAICDLASFAEPSSRLETLFCYCEQTIAKFQEWLAQRYESLDRLNEAWVRRYPNWKAIDAPRHAEEMCADWMDWRQFIQERTTEYLEFRASIVRKIDNARLIETHVAYAAPFGPVTVRGIAPQKMAEVVQAFGISFYPRGFSAIPIETASGEFDFVRCCAKSGEFWLTELQGGQFLGVPMPPNAIRMWSWLAITAGAKAILYWTFLTEGAGIESGGFGLVSRNGEPTERVAEASAMSRLVQARWGWLKAYRPTAQVAILFDQDNSLLTYAQMGDEKSTTQSMAGYCKALWHLDLPLDFIEAAEIESSRHRVLIVPWHIIGKEATCRAIGNFADRGGTVLLESGFGRFDEKYYFNPVVPPHGLAEKFGYRELESIVVADGKVPPEAISQEPGVGADRGVLIFSQPIDLKLTAQRELTSIEVSSAIPIGKWQQSTVAATKKVGRGQIYYVGTNLGASVAGDDRAGIELLGAVLSQVVSSRIRCPGALRPRLLEAEGSALLVVFNDTDMEQSSEISVPNKYRKAVEIYHGDHYFISQGRLELSVPLRNVRVFDLDER